MHEDRTWIFRNCPVSLSIINVGLWPVMQENFGSGFPAELEFSSQTVFDDLTSLIMLSQLILLYLMFVRTIIVSTSNSVSFEDDELFFSQNIVSSEPTASMFDVITLSADSKFYGTYRRNSIHVAADEFSRADILLLRFVIRSDRVASSFSWITRLFNVRSYFRIWIHGATRGYYISGLCPWNYLRIKQRYRWIIYSRLRVTSRRLK
jgi:hypothetical protein